MNKCNILLLLMFTAFFAKAQEEEFEIFDEVIIEAVLQTITDESRDRQVFVLSRADIDKLPAKDVNDLLKYLPGVEIQSRGAFGVQSDISVRGGTYNQILVLIDGMEVNDPLTGHFNLNLPVLMSDILRIEIVKGPVSTIYGPDAVAGVVNIITKSFTQNEDRPKSNLNAELLAGQFGLLGSEFNASHGKNPLSLGGRVLQSDGQNLNADTALSYFKQYGAFIAKQFEFPKYLRWNVRLSHDYRDFDARYYYTRSTFDQSVEKVTRTLFQSNLQKITKHETIWNWNTTYGFTTDSFIFNPLFTPNYHESATLRSRLMNKFAISPNLNVYSGVDMERVELRSTDRGDHTLNHFGGFAMFQYSRTWTVSGSARLDYEKSYGLQFSPQVSMNRSWSTSGVYASASRSIRSADLTEKYVSTNIPGVLSSGRNLGNPDLSSENAWSFELGGMKSWSKYFKSEVSIYYRKSSDLIDYIFTSGSNISNATNIVDSNSYFYATNITKMDVFGTDFVLNFKKNFGDWNLKANVGYTYLKDVSNVEVTSKYLSNFAGDLLTGMLSVDYKNRVYLSFSNVYKTRNSESATAIAKSLEPSYNLSNLKVGWKIVERLDWSVNCQNLFNESYSDILGAQLPRRWIFSQLSLQIHSKP